MKRLVIAVTCISLAGCAINPVVDLKTSKNPDNYEADLAECRQLAQVDHQQNTAGMIVIGAVLGALIGQAMGGSQHRDEGAGFGADTFGAGGLAESMKAEKTALDNCLRNRGYQVLR